jgi:phenylalanyl-tRNA synthetase beta chain
LREDLAVVLPETVSAADAIAAIREAGGPDLNSVAVFDLYRGDQIGSGNVSLAFHLEFQSPDRTLTGEDVGARREAIDRALTDLGGMLRA